MFNLSLKGQEIYKKCFPLNEESDIQELNNIKRRIKFSISCPECHKLYQNRSILIAHLQSKHGITCSKAELRLPCIQCGKKFKKRIHLTTHIESVHEGIKYNCNQCDKKFTQKAQLKRHFQRAHNDNGFVT